MRLLASMALAGILVTGAMAQHGGFRGGGGGFRGGVAVGGGVHRGGGFVGGGVSHGGGFVGGVHHGSFVGNFGFGTGYRGYFGYGHRGYWNGYYLPYSYVWPSYLGYYGYPGYYGYYPPYVADYGFGYPSMTAVSPYTAEPPAPVIITQQFTPASPVVHEYPPYGVRAYEPPADAPAPPAASANRSTVYLIAFKDGVIRPALAYWIENGTLHYLDMDHRQRQAALDTVDRAFSTQLNRERRVPFSLPE